MTSKNYSQVFRVFKKSYKLVPLEIFGDDPYKTLVSTLLSSRTKDEVTLLASKRLFELAPNIHKLKNIKTNIIEKLIYPVGFYKTKARHLEELSRKVISNHDGKIPTTRAELTNLPGVGRKTANLVLSRAFGNPAIAVDTHVHRITNLLGWVKTKNPEKTEKKLEEVLPKKYWKDINRLFVSIGQQYGSGKKLLIFLSDNNLLKKQ